MKAILALLFRHLKAWFTASPSADARPELAIARATQFEALEPRILFSGAQADLPEEPHSGEEPPAEVAFAESLGGEEANGNAVDGAGNVYVVGNFQGSIDADPADGSGNVVTLNSNGGDDVYISKFDNAGNLLWAKSFGGAEGYDSGSDIDVDASGNVYVTGSFSGTVDFDPDASGNAFLSSASFGGFYGKVSSDAFITKFDTNGDFLWARSFGGAEGSDYGNGIDLDASGNVYVTGTFYESAYSDASGNHVGVFSQGDEDAFITKLDTDGNFEWATSFGGNSWGDRGNDIAVDDSGNAYVIGDLGSAYGGDPSGNATVVNHGSNSGDIFVAKIDTTGEFEWARAFGGYGDDRGNAIDVDGSGNVFITGSFYNTASFQSDPSGGLFEVFSNGSHDAFVAKLNTSGDTQWAQSFGGGGTWGDDWGSDIDVDDAGQVYVTGSFDVQNGAVDFDPDPSGEYLLDGIGYGRDIFVSKLDTDGDLQWAVEAGGDSGSDSIGINLAVDGSGSVFVVGEFGGGFYGGADFDPSDGELLIESPGFYGCGTAGFIWKLTAGDGDTPPPPPPPNTVFVDENDRLIVNSDDDGDTISIKIVGGNVVVSTTDDSVVGGNGTNTNPTTRDVRVALAGLTGITLTTGGGDDKITIGALGNLSGNLIIDGGDGIDKITLGGNTTVAGDVDLDAEEMFFQNGQITASGDIEISATDSGNGTAPGADGLSLQNFDLNAGGNLTLEGQAGNGNATTASGNVGIMLTTASALIAGGDITLRGTGGQSFRGGNYGVVFYSGSTLATTGSGSVRIEGTAGTGGNNNDGVYFAPSGSGVTVEDGALEILGTGGLGGNTSRGVALDGAKFFSTSSGMMSVIGVGGGGAGTSGNSGIIVKNTVMSGDSGNITLAGTSGAGKNSNMGVEITGSSALSTDDGGSIDIDGTSVGGIGSGIKNIGVVISSATASVQIQGTGSTGTVTIDGTGGTADATNDNYGVQLVGAVRTVDGDLTINGTAGGKGNTNRGVVVQSTTVEATGTGAVSITGTGTQNTSTGTSNDGVLISTGAGKSVKTVSGNLTITGHGGKGATTNYGVRIVNSTVNAGTGFLNILGTASSATTGSSNIGVHISGATSIGGAVGSLISGTGGGLSGNLNHGVNIAVGITTILPDGEVQGTAGFGAGSKGRIGKYTDAPPPAP
jgi:hypothetical protein